MQGFTPFVGGVSSRAVLRNRQPSEDEPHTVAAGNTTGQESRWRPMTQEEMEAELDALEDEEDTKPKRADQQDPKSFDDDSPSK